jgi:signal-transduction protein with cAMP-binding, CBS, and nucleotidyltransferase domain
MMKASGVDFVFFFENKEDELSIKDEVKIKVATLHDVLVAQNSGKLVLSAVGGQESPTIKDSDSLYDAFNLLMSTGGEIIAVSNQGRITGKISYKDISKAYHHKIHSKS